MDRKSLLVIFIIGLVLFSISGCATAQSPGNSEYAWLNGTWEGSPLNGRGFPMRLQLQVVNGDEVVGKLAWYRKHLMSGSTRWVYDGVVWNGSIYGVVVDLEIKWMLDGTHTPYVFVYDSESQVLRALNRNYNLTKLKNDPPI